MATEPVTAARRPRRPPKANSAAAIANHSFELLAERERRRSGTSSVGVLVPSTAR